MRLAVYTDYTYHRSGGEVYADRAFALFIAALRVHFSRLLLVGRLTPNAPEARYPVGSDVELLGLPFYPSLARPHEAIPTFARAAARFWRALPEIDCVWLLGPHPVAIVFALLARIRRKRVVLGVRQDLPAYARSRHRSRPGIRLAAWMLERSFRLLARVFPTVAVGPHLAHNYRRSRAVAEITVSLVDRREIVSPAEALERAYDGELQVLAVGRIEEEKNPLLLADALARLNHDDRRWRLVVCGEGELRGPLEARLAELGQDDRAELLGYVPFGEALIELYRASHVFLHTAWTEGLPGVIVEAFAAGLPVVAADVGGIGEAVGDAAVLVPPGDPGRAAQAVARVGRDQGLRARLVARGNVYASAHNREAEARAVADFLRGP